MADMQQAVDKTRASAAAGVFGAILVICGLVPLLAVGLLDVPWQDGIMMSGGVVLLITGCVILGRQSVRK